MYLHIYLHFISLFNYNIHSYLHMLIHITLSPTPRALSLSLHICAHQADLIFTSGANGISFGLGHSSALLDGQYKVVA
jgi:hypothetical protein